MGQLKGAVSAWEKRTLSLLPGQRVHNGSHSLSMSGGGRRVTKDKLNDKEEVLPFLQWDVMSLGQLEGALAKSEEELQLLLSEQLGLTSPHLCMREAALLQYYLQGLSWSRDTHLSPLQTSFIMAVLHTLLHNITEKNMDFVNNVLEFAKMMTAACQCPPVGSPANKGPSPLLSLEDAEKLISFISDSLFQKYQLFRALGSRQEELLLGSQETVDVLWSQDELSLLEEGISTHLVPLDTFHQQRPVSDDTAS